MHVAETEPAFKHCIEMQANMKKVGLITAHPFIETMMDVRGDLESLSVIFAITPSQAVLRSRTVAAQPTTSTWLTRLHKDLVRFPGPHAPPVQSAMENYMFPVLFPMLVPPRDWTRHDSGAYIKQRVSVGTSEASCPVLCMVVVASAALTDMLACSRCAGDADQGQR